MDQRISFITLGVKNLEESKNFYKKNFGWEPIKDNDGIVFFKMNGLIFGLFPSQELAEDAGMNYIENKGFHHFSLAINLKSEKAVDEIFSDFKQKNIKIIKNPEKVFWGGYRGYIADPDGHLWEFAYNPFLELDENGIVISHK